MQRICHTYLQVQFGWSQTLFWVYRSSCLCTLAQLNRYNLWTAAID
jgi:hypothetical protein